MQKILVIGFQRSGTTLLRKILQRHPEVRIMFHEKRILNKPNELQKQLDRLKDNIWGEKVPYYNNSLVKYVKNWQKLFSDKYKVIHILRHPNDVLDSNKRTFNKGYTISANYYNTYVPQVLKKTTNIKHIKFEDLVIDQMKTMKELFDYCELDSSDKIIEEIRSQDFKYFENINDERAFNFRLDLNHLDFDDTIKLIDDVVGGRKYAQAKKS